jgi:hypothetical protein
VHALLVCGVMGGARPAGLSVGALGHGRRLDVGGERALAVGGGGRGRRGQLGDGGGAGLAVVVLALAPDEGVETHHYDRGPNHAANHKGRENGIDQLSAQQLVTDDQ